jgi:hypothetical protein
VTAAQGPEANAIGSQNLTWGGSLEQLRREGATGNGDDPLGYAG